MNVKKQHCKITSKANPDRLMQAAALLINISIRRDPKLARKMTQQAFEQLCAAEVKHINDINKSLISHIDHDYEFLDIANEVKYINPIHDMIERYQWFGFVVDYI